jgi:hypothetical protein
MKYQSAFKAALNAACDEWSLTRDQIMTRGRTNVESVARHSVAFALRSLGASFSEIGAIMAGRHHGTAANSVKVAMALCDYDRGFRARAFRVRDAAKSAHEDSHVEASAAAVIIGVTANDESLRRLGHASPDTSTVGEFRAFMMRMKKESA